MENIITAKEAKAISETNKSVGFKSIMDRVEEYATQGKTEFEIRVQEKESVKRFEYELTQLGYTIKVPEKGAWVLSWSDADKSSRSKYLSKKDIPIYIDLRLMRKAVEGSGYTIQDFVDLVIEKNIIIVDSEV